MCWNKRPAEGWTQETLPKVDTVVLVADEVNVVLVGEYNGTVFHVRELWDRPQDVNMACLCEDVVAWKYPLA